MTIHGIEESDIASLIDIEAKEVNRVLELDWNMRYVFYRLTNIWVGTL
jgi:hypothetical protein